MSVLTIDYPYGEETPEDHLYLGLASIFFDIDSNGHLNFFQVNMGSQVVVENSPALLTFLNGAIQNNWSEHLVATPGKLRLQLPKVSYTEMSLYMLTGWSPMTYSTSSDLTKVSSQDVRRRVRHHRIYSSGTNRIFGVTALKKGKSRIANLVTLSFGNHDLVIILEEPHNLSCQTPEDDGSSSDNEPDTEGAAGFTFTLLDIVDHYSF